MAHFKPLRAKANAHPRHEYTSAMSQRSNSRILDVLLFNENTEMRQNLSEMHNRYTPVDREGNVFQVAYPGDELHFERIRGVTGRMCHHDTTFERLQGGVPTTGELHGSFCWLQVNIYIHMQTSQSLCSSNLKGY